MQSPDRSQSGTDPDSFSSSCQVNKFPLLMNRTFFFYEWLDKLWFGVWNIQKYKHWQLIHTTSTTFPKSAAGWDGGAQGVGGERERESIQKLVYKFLHKGNLFINLNFQGRIPIHFPCVLFYYLLGSLITWQILPLFRKYFSKLKNWNWGCRLIDEMKWREVPNMLILSLKNKMALHTFSHSPWNCSLLIE